MFQKIGRIFFVLIWGKKWQNLFWQNFSVKKKKAEFLNTIFQAKKNRSKNKVGFFTKKKVPHKKNRCAAQNGANATKMT